MAGLKTILLQADFLKDFALSVGKSLVGAENVKRAWNP